MRFNWQKNLQEINIFFIPLRLPHAAPIMNEKEGTTTKIAPTESFAWLSLPSVREREDNETKMVPYTAMSLPRRRSTPAEHAVAELNCRAGRRAVSERVIYRK